MSRTKKHVLAMLAAAPLLLASGHGFAATGQEASKPVKPETESRGEILSLSCAGCHGTDGKSASIIPSIYGKSPDYIETALIDFKNGSRQSTVMDRHAKGYSDDEIHLIAEYFGNLSKKNH